MGCRENADSRGASRPRKAFSKRMAIALCSGYIIVYYGEFVFWATPEHEGFDAAGFIAIWLAYSMFAYPFLCVASLFNVRDPWAVFLARRILRLVRGGHRRPNDVRHHPMARFPRPSRSPAWRGTRFLTSGSAGILYAKSWRKTSISRPFALACAIGLFYGFWSIFWWNQPPPPMKDVARRRDRRTCCSSTSLCMRSERPLLLVFAHWLYNHVRIAEFKPSKLELGMLGLLVLLYYAFITVPAAPKSLWVLPPLLAVTFWCCLPIAASKRVRTPSSRSPST